MTDLQGSVYSTLLLTNGQDLKDVFVPIQCATLEL